MLGFESPEEELEEPESEEEEPDDEESEVLEDPLSDSFLAAAAACFCLFEERVP